MSSPPRRARFQIHLSTAIVLMFVAGGLIWANVNARRLSGSGYEPSEVLLPTWRVEVSNFQFSGSGTFEEIRFVTRGWPFDVMLSRTMMFTNRDGIPLDAPFHLRDEWRIGPIVYNALIALSILFAVWFICEWLIRWRATRKKD